MAKTTFSFRLSDNDIELLDTLVKNLTNLHGTDYSRTNILTMAIRKLAREHLTDEQVREILDK